MRTVLVILLLFLAAYFGFNYVYENNTDVFKTFTSSLLPENKQKSLEAADITTSSTASDPTLNHISEGLPPASYEPYDDSKIAYAKRAPVVLFFFAEWCPSCQSTERIFAKKITSLPPGVKILKIDYDTALDLKQKYHIEYQHTFVQVDENGNELARWSGGAIDGIVANLVQ